MSFEHADRPRPAVRQSGRRRRTVNCNGCDGARGRRVGWKRAAAESDVRMVPVPTKALLSKSKGAVNSQLSMRDSRLNL